MATEKKPVELAPFTVVAEKLWHSTECKFYFQGETVMLPASTKVREDSAVQPIAPEAEAAKGKKSDKDIA